MTEEEKELYAATFPVHVGVDTGKTFHKLVTRRQGQKRSAAYKVLVSRDGFDAADAHLSALFPDVPRERMLVGIEFAGHHGFTFAHDLARRGYVVVNVLPSATKHTKDVGTNSTNKSDDIDAWQICKLTGQGVFVRFPLLDEQYTALRLLTTHRHRLSVEEIRFKNRLQSLLDLAWPEFLRHFGNLTARTPLSILERWPLPADLRAARSKTVHDLIVDVSRNHIPPDRINALLAAAQTTVALDSASAVRRHEITALLARWRLVREHMAHVDAELARLVAACPPARALATIPEVSVLCAATLVAELDTPADYESPRQILKLAGMNLSGKESGTSVRSRVRQSKRGRPMLRKQLFLLAGRWVNTRGLYRPQYEAMLTRNGNQRTKAVCAIGRKLVPMLMTVMQSGEPFDRERWLAARHGVTTTTATTAMPEPTASAERGATLQEH